MPSYPTSTRTDFLGLTTLDVPWNRNSSLTDQYRKTTQRSLSLQLKIISEPEIQPIQRGDVGTEAHHEE
jgi:hypothetical protein